MTKGAVATTAMVALPLCLTIALDSIQADGFRQGPAPVGVQLGDTADLLRKLGAKE